MPFVRFLGRLCANDVFVRRFLPPMPFGSEKRWIPSICTACQPGSQELGTTISRKMSVMSADSNRSERTEKELEEDERQGKINEGKFRIYKKLFSTLLFGTTLGLALYGRHRRQALLAEDLKNCVRLPVDENFQGGHKEFFHCKNPDTRGSGCVLPGQMVRDGTIRAIRKFEIRSDDVFVVSFPKSGTTWLQEIVYLIKFDLNFIKAAQKVMETRFPYLEFPYPGISSVHNMPSPRLIKSHLPYDMLPREIHKAKVIYIMRNPKDIAVSYYYFARMLAFSSYHGTMPEFVEKFKNNQIPYTPYFGHLDSFLSRQDDPNILIIRYEDLSRDTSEVIRRIGIFLERPLSNEDVELLVTHTNFNKMVNNPSVNYSHWDDLGIRNEKEAHFLRKGKVGDWRNYFSEQMNKSFDDWINQNNDMGYGFEYNI